MLTQQTQKLLTIECNTTLVAYDSVRESQKIIIKKIGREEQEIQARIVTDNRKSLMMSKYVSRKTKQVTYTTVI